MKGLLTSGMALRRLLRLAVIAGFFWVLGTTGALAQQASGKQEAQSPKEPKPKFVRLVRNEQGTPLALQTALVHYEKRDERGQVVRVDLIGAIHIADKKYYQQLNQLFDRYEVLLYELVASKGARPRRGQAGLYSPIARFLGLADQIREIDYEKPHFVHADMSPEEFAASMRRKQESFMKMFFKILGASLAQQAQAEVDDVDVLVALLSGDKKRLRRVLAIQMAQSQSVLRVLEGDQGSTLIAERNKVALKVMQEQIQKGKRYLGIFYGAGHLEDLDRRLRQQGFRRTGIQWLTAWDLK